MLIPIRCFSCNKVVGNKWDSYCSLIQTMSPGEALNRLGLRRYCCRRMILGHINLIDQVLEQPLIDMSQLHIK